MVYYFNTWVNGELEERTFTDFDEARSACKAEGLQKFRDTLGGEYFINN